MTFMPDLTAQLVETKNEPVSATPALMRQLPMTVASRASAAGAGKLKPVVVATALRQVVSVDYFPADK